jgi:hypothetical protein
MVLLVCIGVQMRLCVDVLMTLCIPVNVMY